jgi:O-acetyl-ADP-ribose deacetylase (regulator of RNase III)
MASEWKAGNGYVELVEGDITHIAVDAIVNAANSALAGGGGVDGAIHRVGGPEIMRELDEIRARIGLCPTGDAVVTGAGRLPAKYVFHAVGPIYRDGKREEARMLRSCYEACLRLAEERDVHVISFPSISTGVYGYPLQEAAEIALRAVTEHLLRTRSAIERVILVQFGAQAQEVYWRAAARESRLEAIRTAQEASTIPKRLE